MTWLNHRIARRVADLCGPRASHQATSSRSPSSGAPRPNGSTSSRGRTGCLPSERELSSTSPRVTNPAAGRRLDRRFRIAARSGAVRTLISRDRPIRGRVFVFSPTAVVRGRVRGGQALDGLEVGAVAGEQSASDGRSAATRAACECPRRPAAATTWTAGWRPSGRGDGGAQLVGGEAGVAGVVQHVENQVAVGAGSAAATSRVEVVARCRRRHRPWPGLRARRVGRSAHDRARDGPDDRGASPPRRPRPSSVRRSARRQ